MKNDSLTYITGLLENIWQTQYWQRIIANCIAAGFIIATGITIFNTGQVIINSIAIKQNRTVNKPVETNTAVTFTEIQRWHLFGEQPTALTLASKTNLQLILVGILTATPTQAAQVIIATPDGDQKTYSIGQQLPGDAVLYKILSNSIIILHNGRLEELSMTNWGDANSATATATDNSNAPPATDDTSEAAAPLNNIPPEIEKKIPAEILKKFKNLDF